MSIINITERVARERKQCEQANLLAAGTIKACAWHLTMVASYLNETGRVDLAEGLCASAEAITAVADVLNPVQTWNLIQPLHPRDIG